MNKIKKFWREIVIGILVLFGVGKCTQSCSRDSKLTEANKTIETLDSTVNALAADTLNKAHQIAILNEQINTANEKVNLANANQATAEANKAAAQAEADAAKARQREAEARAAAKRNRQ